jgi:hypothetical protein
VRFDGSMADDRIRHRANCLLVAAAANTAVRPVTARKRRGSTALTIWWPSVFPKATSD